MRPITYTLAGADGTSDEYYAKVAGFTDSLLEVMKDIPVEDLLGNERTREEYLLDLLLTGVLLRTYGRKAMTIADVSKDHLKTIAFLRRQRRSLRPVLDDLKGRLSTRILHVEPEEDILLDRSGLEGMAALIEYLEATGEFDEECIRVKELFNALSVLDLDEADRWISIALTTAEWFEHQSINRLGGYTENVDDFLSCELSNHLDREDIIFCARRRVEYHLNMVGAEMMNRSYRKEFLSRSTKIVVLPTCMALRGVKCPAEDSGMGMVCKGCSPDCIVNRLTRIGNEKGAPVIMAAHSSSFMNEGPGVNDVAVLGVACVLNLLSGGLKARRMGIPAQCVLLDGCGCRSHWDENGVPTSLNIDQFSTKLGGL